MGQPQEYSLVRAVCFSHSEPQIKGKNSDLNYQLIVKVLEFQTGGFEGKVELFCTTSGIFKQNKVQLETLEKALEYITTATGMFEYPEVPEWLSIPEWNERDLIDGYVDKWAAGLFGVGWKFKEGKNKERLIA